MLSSETLVVLPVLQPADADLCAVSEYVQPDDLKVQGRNIRRFKCSEAAQHPAGKPLQH